MGRLEFLIIFMCVVLSTAKLLGPDTRKDLPKINEDEDEKSTPDDMSTESPGDQEYMDELAKVVNNEVNTMKQYMESLKDSKQLSNDGDNIEDNRIEHLQYYLNMLEKTLIRHTGKSDTVNDEKTSVKNEEKQHEIPQLVLDPLPPLVEEEEPELTPELKEAKELYDSAVAKLSRRTTDIRGTIFQIKQAADIGYIPAKIKLAWSYLYGEGVEFDPSKGKEIFEALAEDGVADAHAGMGFLYATGITVPVSQPKALVHYTMGAAGDSTYAQMALAYRHWAGVTVPSSCPKAMDLYMRVAEKVARNVPVSGGAGIQRVRLQDEADSGTSGALDSDLIDYYQLLAEKGDVQAQVGLGQLHFQGGRGVTLDMNKAHHYFQQAAKAGNAVANAFLGKIYLDGGDGIQADNETALRYFKKAADLNNPVGQSGLGIMYLHGRGVAKDTETALKYFTLAANQGWVEGQLHLGFMYIGGISVRRDFKQAIKYFSLASQSGHVLALYHLAQMHARGLGVLRSCTTAVELFKNVCERGRWSARLQAAHAAWRARSPDAALLQYLALAERGLEVAQSNAAYLLDIGAVSLFPPEERWRRALQAWARAAAQGCAAARVRLGDYHYYGLGTHVDLEAAAHHYRIASEQLHNAQATFNLGYMHERGLGLARDVHLAKRCYDLAAESAPEARLPAALALARLNAQTALLHVYTVILQTPISALFLAGDSTSNWDLYLITALLGALGLVVYLRRPALPTN